MRIEIIIFPFLYSTELRICELTLRNQSHVYSSHEEKVFTPVEGMIKMNLIKFSLHVFTQAESKITKKYSKINI